VSSARMAKKKVRALKVLAMASEQKLTRSE
jgi:hypothetical protein